jgi:general secretion pathway protein B
MSFILDALKKSETDRQQQGSAEFAGVPTSNRRESPPRWLWALGLLLAINLVVLVGLIFRPDPSPPVAVPAPVATQTTQAAPEKTDAFAEQLAAARQNAPRPEVSEPEAVQTSVAETAPPGARSTNQASTSQASTNLSLPTIHEVVANGTITLPELHVDIHVYSELPEDRFVFINMNKHKEGTRLTEGPLVREITPQGVVLDHNGTSFLLPRD